MLFLFDEYMFFLFPKCVAGVPVSLWGWRVRSLDVAFMFATVRNRSQPSAPGHYGRAYGKFCKRGRSWRLHMSRCFVSRGRRDTS